MSHHAAIVAACSCPFGISTGLSLVCLALSIYWLVLFVRILASWFPPPREGPLRTVMRGIYGVTDPVLRPLRSLVPPIRAGMMAIDISPIIVFILIGVLRRAIGCAGFGF
jgi:YggT family protein